MVAKFSFARLRKEYLERLAEDELERESQWLRLASLYEDPNLFLGAAQFGITWIAMLLGYVAYELIDDLSVGIFGPDWEWLAAVLVVLVLLSLHWVFAELIPKSLGLNFAADWLRRTYRPVVWVGRLLSPLLWLGKKIANYFLSFAHAEVTTEVDLSHSEEEIRLLINASHLDGQIDEREGELIKNAFDFVDRLAREVMVPRQDMAVLYYEDSMETMRAAIRDSRHTRYPLCDGDKDHIIGMIHVKNFMEEYVNGGRNVKKIITEILVVPEVMPIVDLLQLMKMRRIYLAVVVDEYGGTMGLVALEDIIEELVGDIQDEHDDRNQDAVVAHPDGSYEFEGSVILEDVAEELGIEFDEADTDTIGGYVFAMLERIPRVGDHVKIGDWDFRVDKLNGFRILRLTVKPLPPEEDGEK